MPLRQSLRARVRPLVFLARKLVRGELNLSELAYSNNLFFSQFGEDVLIASYFPGRNDGFYVDVGAFHPFNISNTHAFYKRGWRGINIEPNPLSFGAFLRHRPRDINLNLAVSRQAGELTFNCLEEMSGIDDGTYLFSGRKGARAQQVTVQARPLAEILAEHVPPGTAIDFMSVDCEGHDEEVLRSSDWTRFRPRVLLVEDHGKHGRSINSVLEPLGYRHERTLGLTKLFVEASFRAN